jgi:hypothetical protein
LRLLAPHGMVVWQHTVRRCIPALVRGLSLWQSRCYGNTQLSFYVFSSHSCIGAGSHDSLGRAEAAGGEPGTHL